MNKDLFFFLNNKLLIQNILPQEPTLKLLSLLGWLLSSADNKLLTVWTQIWILMVLIWIQSVWHSDGVPIFFFKKCFKNVEQAPKGKQIVLPNMFTEETVCFFITGYYNEINF